MNSNDPLEQLQLLDGARIKPPARGVNPGDDLSNYAAAVDDALRNGRDIWGEQVMADPNGPSYEGVVEYLAPLALGDHNYLTESGSYYVVFTEPLEASSFALHVADGSQILVEYTNLWGAPDWALPFPEPKRGGEKVLVFDFFVGKEGREKFGQRPCNVDSPSLLEGWLPILLTEYVDEEGIHFRRESLTTRDPLTGELASFLRFEIISAPESAGQYGEIEVGIRGNGEEKDSRERFTLATDGRALYLQCANAPGKKLVSEISIDYYEEAKRLSVTYWKETLAQGATIEVPDSRIMNAMRNLLIQNLVLGERYSLGNPYETTFLMEAHGAVLSLLRYGFQERATQCLDKLAGMTNGAAPEWYESWERGVKLIAAAEHHRLTGKNTIIREHEEVYLNFLRDFQAQRRKDPHGLLAPERYAWDIPMQVYGWHSQAVAWQGMRDIINTYLDQEVLDNADTLVAEVNDFRAALLAAMDRSTTYFEDGRVFIPVALLAEESPHESLTGTRLANYWNLVAPYALATGILTPGGALAKGVMDYLASHGAWLLGLTRYNGLYDPPTPIGSWREDGTGGYRSPGIDNAFGVQILPFLADNGEADRLGLALYAKLAHGMTRGTFVDGEATTIGVSDGEFYRSTWYPPNGTSNAMFLDALRLVLLRERRNEKGRVDRIDLAWATPRHWLAEGQQIVVDRLPTSLGEISYRIESHLEAGYISIEIQPPESDGEVSLHLRLPAGYSVDENDELPKEWDVTMKAICLLNRREFQSFRLPVVQGKTP